MVVPKSCFTVGLLLNVVPSVGALARSAKSIAPLPVRLYEEVTREVVWGRKNRREHVSPAYAGGISKTNREETVLLMEPL